MLFDAVVLAIVVALAAGGRFQRLTDLDLQMPWAFVAAAAIQVGLLTMGLRRVLLPAGTGQALYLASLGLVFLGLWANRRLPGVRLAGLGVLLNALVIAANGGSMPVDRELAVRAGSAAMVELLDSPEYTRHVAAGPGTRLRPLGDVLPLPMLVPRPRFYSPGSIGDVFVTAGVCWLVLAGMGAFGARCRRASAEGRGEVG